MKHSRKVPTNSLKFDKQADLYTFRHSDPLKVRRNSEVVHIFNYFKDYLSMA